MNRSRLVMLLMLVVAAGFAAISVVFYHSMTHHVIQWWGTADARLVMDAPRVEALSLAGVPTKPSPAKSSAKDTLNLPDGMLEVTERRDVTAAGGLEALRHGLLEDANYDWAADPSLGAGHWQYALVFSESNGPSRVSVLFSFPNHLGRQDTGATVALADSAASWQKFFTEVFAAPR
jgi:hypothetical protein